MLAKEEKEFLQYWEQNRVTKKKWIRHLSVGLPLGVTLVLTSFVNLFSGWYGRAQMVFSRESTSLVLVLLVAAISIVLFVIIFSARHRWEMNEQRYQELKQKE
ncbi:MAG TPA: hypothetical protein DCP55_07195 [Chitinophagaceae bacterium]|nr:hypothetical protein [Chitinophagaceae bacterium]